MAMNSKKFDINKKDHKFSMKPHCSMCGEDFDWENRIPKVLECGHSMCVLCIDKIIQSIQVTIIGDGESQTNFSCTICRSSMVIPSRGASAFPTNHELVETLKPSDIRFVTCAQCLTKSNELSFHICRECTIEKHDYDIKDFSHTNSDVGLDLYAICSTCAFNKHNDENHTVIDFYPLRAHWYFKKYTLSVKATSSALKKNFGDVRTTLATTPLYIEETENEIGNMVDFMRRCKSSQQQAIVLERYTANMVHVIGLLANIHKKIGEVNEHVSTMSTKLREENEKIEGLYCEKDVKSIHDLLSKCMDREPFPDPFFEESEQENDEVVSHASENEENFEPPVVAVNETDWKVVAIQIMKVVASGAHFLAANVSSGIHQLVNLAHDANNDNSARTVPIVLLFSVLVAAMAVLIFVAKIFI